MALYKYLFLQIMTESVNVREKLPSLNKIILISFKSNDKKLVISTLDQPNCSNWVAEKKRILFGYVMTFLKTLNLPVLVYFLMVLFILPWYQI